MVDLLSHTPDMTIPSDITACGFENDKTPLHTVSSAEKAERAEEQLGYIFASVLRKLKDIMIARWQDKTSYFKRNQFIYKVWWELSSYRPEI